MTIKLRVIKNGNNYELFDSISVARSLDSIAGNFSVTFTVSDYNANGGQKLPLLLNEDVQIEVDGRVELTGRIEAARVAYAADKHTVTFTGRDKTGDLIDSSVGDWAIFTAASLPEIILRTLTLANMDDIGLSFSSGLKGRLDAEPFGIGDGSAGDVGDTVFNFLESYCRKRQVLMSTDGFGGIKLLDASDVSNSGAQIINRINDDGSNNVLMGQVDIDTTKRFNKFVVSSAGNASQVNEERVIDTEDINVTLDEVDDFFDQFDNDGVVSDLELSNSRGEFVDEGTPLIRRVKHIQAEATSSQKDCQARAIWEYNLSLGQYLKYVVTLQGHSDSNGKQFVLNNLYRIQDDFAGLSEDLLLKSIKWDVSLKGGSTTQLVFVLPEAYKNAGDKPEVTKSTKDEKRTSAGGAVWSID